MAHFTTFEVWRTEVTFLSAGTNHRDVTMLQPFYSIVHELTTEARN